MSCPVWHHSPHSTRRLCPLTTSAPSCSRSRSSIAIRQGGLASICIGAAGISQRSGSSSPSAIFEKQGACVSVSAISDENYLTSNELLLDYTEKQFLNQLIWAIAHELGHLTTAGHITDPSGHLSNANTLMTDGNPAPDGITVIMSTAEELEKVDLKTRFSVQH